MKEYYTPIELEKLKLPRLPATRRRISHKANQEHWQSRPRQGRGGGFEYHISSLPPETQKALRLMATNKKLKEFRESSKEGVVEGTKLRIKNEISEEMSEKNRLNGLTKAKGLKGMAKDRMDAKLEIIALWEFYYANGKETKTSALNDFVSAYNSGALEADDALRKVLPTISQPSLMRWIKLSKTRGIASLAGNYGNRKNSGLFENNQELTNFCSAMVTEYPHITASNLFYAIQARFKDAVFPLPSQKTTSRWLSKFREEYKTVLTSLNAPDTWKNTQMSGLGSTTENITYYLQQWQMDSTPTDIMLSDGRHAILGVIDVYSRRVKFLVCKTSKAAAVSALIRRALIEWGIPSEIKMDNGADYKSNHVARVLEALQIKQTFCAPFSPWQKPEIERAFRTFSHGILELCPQFIGHNVAERRSIEERKSFADRLLNRDKNGVKKANTESEPINAEFMSSLDLQELCDKWSNGLYFISPHSELKMSPMDKIAEWLSKEGNKVRRISGDAIRGLDILLAPVPGNDGKRTVGKKGIWVDGRSYYDDALIGYMGKTVYVAYDMTDYGRVSVFSLDGEGGFICSAVCPEALGIDRAELAAKARSVQAKQLREARASLRKIAKEANVKGIHKEIVDFYAEKAETLRLPNETEEEYSTRKLEAAAEAAMAMEEMKREPTFDSVNESAGAISEETAAQLDNVIKLDFKRETLEERENREKGERMARYEALSAKNFENISEEDEAWRRSWEKTPEYDTWRLCGNIYAANK